MNSKNLFYHRLAFIVTLLITIGLASCVDPKPNAESPKDPTEVPDEQTIFIYQPFTLELAAEELIFLESLSENGGNESPRNSTASRVARLLMNLCNVDCENDDYDCIKNQVDCGQYAATYATGDDGDGAEPLPIPSDTSIIAYVSSTEIQVYSQDPKVTSYELISRRDGGVFGSGTSSSEGFRYDKQKHLAKFKVDVKNPELFGDQLSLIVHTKISDSAGEERIIDLKQPFLLIFEKD